jgi:type VI secretion system protein VasJ
LDVAEWRGIGTRPISAAAPAGVSARYDPDFESLAAQIQRLEGLGREPVDWPQVVSLARGILEHKSKDVLVCSYAALGLLQLEGLSGLTKGLACMEAMVSGFWPNLFPELKRAKARTNALNWLALRAGTAISQKSVKTDGDVSTACEAQIKSLAAVVQEKVPVDPPDWTDLLRPLQELAAQAQAAHESEQSSQREVAKPAAATVAPAQPETAEDAARFVSETVGSLTRALAISRAADPSAPMPYLLTRALTWSEIETLPPTTENQTLIPPPPVHVKNRCEDLAAESSWKELLDEAEDRLAEFPLWLDLQRMSDQALGGLGKKYAAARTAVRAEVISLLTRLPELPALQFSDGTPFADDSTQRWISAELSPARTDTVAAPSVTGADAEALAALRENSRKLLSEGKQAEAIRLLQDAVKSASTERTRFLRQTELAMLCFEAGQLKPALACFEVLDEQIRRFSLERWEPDLCVEVFRLYWEALNKLAQTARQLSPEVVRQADVVYNRLCNLDVLAGLDLTHAVRR